MSEQPIGDGWAALGDHLRADTGRLERGLSEHERLYRFAVASETHFWLAILQHRASDQLLDSVDGRGDGAPILDVDTLLGPPAVMCFVCEQPYSRQLRRRKCPGDPNPGGKL